VLGALHRVGVDAEQAEEAAGRGGDPLVERLAVVADRLGRGGERLEDRDGEPGLAAGGIDAELGALAEALDAGAVLPPFGQPLLPERRLLRRVLGRLEPRLAGLALVDPGAKSSPRSPGKVSRRLERSPLGSMAIAGTWSIAASSSRLRQSPVLPLPVMPTQTACVTRSRES